MSRVPPMPPRPAVPVAAYGLIAAIVASQAVLKAQGDWPAAAFVVAGFLVVVVIVGLALRRTGRQELSGIVLAASLVGILGCASASAVALRTASCADALGSSAVSSWSFELVSDMSFGATSWRGRAKALGPGGEQGFVWLTCSEELLRGETVRGVGRFKESAADAWGRSSSGQGVSGTVALSRVKGRDAASGAYGALLAFRRCVVVSFYPEDGGTASGALLAGLVCGYSAPAKAQGLSDDFAACGASHLIAVSGSHLALIASLLTGLIKMMRLRKATKLVLLTAATGVFVVICGVPLSAVRSWLMSIAAGASELAGRRGHPLSALSVMGCAIALADPCSTGQMGFQLSLLCVGGICLFGKYTEHQLLCLATAPERRSRAPEWARPHLRRARSYTYQALATTVVCQLVSAPVCLPAFGTFSLVAPVANIALGALFTPLLGLGALAALFAPLAGANPVLAVARLVGDCFLMVLRRFAGLPLACVAVDADVFPAWAACACAAVALLIFWPEISRKGLVCAVASLAALAVAHLIRWRFFAPASICVLDVGQADAILMRDGASSLMVDAGVDSEVAAALARNNVLHLDGIVLTHLDSDHVGGLDDLVGLVDCDRVYLAAGVSEALSPELASTIASLTGSEPAEIVKGDLLHVGGFTARMVWPREEVEGDENADSVVLGVSFGRGGETLEGLLTGDAESDQLAGILEAGDVGDIDFLKVGHHGSAASITEDEARTLLPEVSVASAGENNRYGHPRQECIDVLESAGSLFLCTKDVGDVTVAPGSNGPQVSCSKRTLTTE